MNYQIELMRLVDVIEQALTSSVDFEKREAKFNASLVVLKNAYDNYKNADKCPDCGTELAQYDCKCCNKDYWYCPNCEGE